MSKHHTVARKALLMSLVTIFSYSATDDENVYGGFVGANLGLAVQDRLTFATDVEFGAMEGGETEIAGRLSLEYLF